MSTMHCSTCCDVTWLLNKSTHIPGLASMWWASSAGIFRPITAHRFPHHLLSDDGLSVHSQKSIHSPLIRLEGFLLWQLQPGAFFYSSALENCCLSVSEIP